MTKLIQRNRIVAPRLFYGPGSSERLLFTVDDGNLIQAGHVGKNPLPLHLQDEALRLGRQLDCPQRFPVRNADNLDSRLVEGHAPNEKLFRCGVVLEFIEAALQIDLGYEVERLAVVDVNALAAGGIELIEFGSEPHSGRRLPIQASQGLAGLQIHNLKGFVSGSGRKEQLVPGVHRHVIEAPLNVPERDGLVERHVADVLAPCRQHKSKKNSQCEKRLVFHLIPFSQHLREIRASPFAAILSSSTYFTESALVQWTTLPASLNVSSLASTFL